MGTTSGAPRGHSAAVTTDRLRWWIVGVVLGAAVLAVASLSEELKAEVASSGTGVVATRGPEPLR